MWEGRRGEERGGGWEGNEEWREGEKGERGVEKGGELELCRKERGRRGRERLDRESER